MAGGPSTPALAAAVSDVGGLGLLAAAYKSPDELQADITRTRELTSAPVGVNMFVLAETPVDRASLTAYAQAIQPEADRHRVALGEPHFDDDSLDAKLEVVCRERPAITSFAFGCPAPEIVQRLHERDIAVWVTVTEVDEALLAAHSGADALIVQGVEAGGHRGSFEDADGRGEIGLLALLRLVARASELPLIASGGIADGAAVAAVIAAGARAAQIGTAFMLCPEAATSDPHRDALTPFQSDGSHARLHRPPRPWHRQRLHARPQRTHTDRLPARALPHRACASGRAQSRGRRSDQPLGRPSAHPRRELPRRRARSPLERRGTRRHRAGPRTADRAWRAADVVARGVRTEQAVTRSREWAPPADAATSLPAVKSRSAAIAPSAPRRA